MHRARLPLGITVCARVGRFHSDGVRIGRAQNGRNGGEEAQLEHEPADGDMCDACANPSHQSESLPHRKSPLAADETREDLPKRPSTSTACRAAGQISAPILAPRA